jgi:hypothetical protein
MDAEVELMDTFDKPSFFHIRQAMDLEGNIIYNILDDSVLPQYNELGVNLIRASLKRNISMGRKVHAGVRYEKQESTASHNIPQLRLDVDSMYFPKWMVDMGIREILRSMEQ